jgi:hypothetical protein
VEDVMIEMNDAMILRIRSLVVAMVNAFDIPAQRELIAQAATIHSPTGIPTMLEFQVDRSLEPAQGWPNPLDVTAEVKTAEGEDLGMLVLWIDAEGYLYSLEFSWVVDDRPDTLPRVEQIIPRLGPSNSWT